MMFSRILQQLEKDIANAATYDEWYAACLEHDRHSGADDWKSRADSRYYDYDLIKHRMDSIRLARLDGDLKRLEFHLHEGLHGNLGNIADPMLYQHSMVGTKYFIGQYLDEVCESLHFLCTNMSDDLPFVEKREIFRTMAHAFGSSTLMLSGGAALGMFHVGVIKALFEQKLIPKVVSGASAGAIVTAVVGTRTDDELAEFINPEQMNLEAFQFLGLDDAWRKKALLSSDSLYECLAYNIPNMTFGEALAKTGRHINIPVSAYERHQQSRVLNARTAPNVLIRQATLASCAVPMVYSPVSLTAKNYEGDEVPYISDRKWIDGSICGDLPIGKLSRVYGVNHSIVSQINPHITPFMSRSGNDESLQKKLIQLAIKNGQTNLYFLLAQAEMRVSSKPVAAAINKLTSVVKQRYYGDINIIPPRRLSNLGRLFLNPSPQVIREFMMLGERETWQKIDMIRNTARISKAFDACLEYLDNQEVSDSDRLSA